MTWWIPFPESFNHDPRVRALSRAARGVLAALVIAAKGKGSIPYVNHHGALGTVHLIAWCEGDDRDHLKAIGAEYRELLDCGVLAPDDGAGRLWLLFGQGADAPRAKEQPSDAPAPAPVRRKPSEGRVALNHRAAKSHFKARRREWAGVDPSMTWEGWLATPAGVAWLQRPCNAPEGVAATPLQRPATPPATPPSPRSPQPRKERGIQSEPPEARAAATPLQRPATPPGPATLQGVAAPPRCGTVEDLAPFDTDTVLDRMRAASGDRLALMLSGKDERIAFALLARGLLAEGHVSVEGLVRAASHAPHDAWVSRQGKLPLHRLMAKGGKLLLDLIAGSSACPACGGAPLGPDAHHPEDDAVEAARRRYRTANTAPAPLPPGAAR